MEEIKGNEENGKRGKLKRFTRINGAMVKVVSPDSFLVYFYSLLILSNGDDDTSAQTMTSGEDFHSLRMPLLKNKHSLVSEARVLEDTGLTLLELVKEWIEALRDALKTSLVYILLH